MLIQLDNNEKSYVDVTPYNTATVYGYQIRAVDSSSSLADTNDMVILVTTPVSALEA